MDTNNSTLEKQREATVDKLVMNYGHGKLSRYDLELRLDQAIDCNSLEELAKLVADLPLDVDAEFEAKKRQDLHESFDEEIDGDDDISHVISIFSGNQRRGNWHTGKEIRVFTMFGGAVLDFRDAVFTSQKVKVKVYCLFGGVDIRVPENVNVIEKAFCFCGGLHNRSPMQRDNNRPTIIVEGMIFFGGAHIRSRPSFRERMLQFADQMRGEDCGYRTRSRIRHLHPRRRA